MNELKTLEDINDFAVNLSYMLKTDIPENVSIRITLSQTDYIKILSDIKTLYECCSGFTSHSIGSRFTYQVMNIKFYITLGE